MRCRFELKIGIAPDATSIFSEPPSIMQKPSRADTPRFRNRGIQKTLRNSTRQPIMLTADRDFRVAFPSPLRRNSSNGLCAKKHATGIFHGVLAPVSIGFAKTPRPPKCHCAKAGAERFPGSTIRLRWWLLRRLLAGDSGPHLNSTFPCFLLFWQGA